MCSFLFCIIIFVADKKLFDFRFYFPQKMEILTGQNDSANSSLMRVSFSRGDPNDQNPRGNRHCSYCDLAQLLLLHYRWQVIKCTWSDS